MRNISDSSSVTITNSVLIKSVFGIDSSALFEPGIGSTSGFINITPNCFELFTKITSESISPASKQSVLNERSSFRTLKASISGTSVELNTKISYVTESKPEYKHILVLLKIFTGTRYWREPFVTSYSGVKSPFGCFR